MIEMNNKQWNEKIKNNFNDAAYRYLEYSNIQKFFSEKIVQFIKELNPHKKTINTAISICFCFNYFSRFNLL